LQGCDKINFSNLIVLQNLPKEKSRLVEQRRAEREEIRLEKPVRLRSEKYRNWIAKKEVKEKEKAKKLQEEKAFSDRIKQERNTSRDKRGIEKYFTPNPNNEVDREIVHRIKELTSSSNLIKNEEIICRKILAKRLGTGVKSNATNKTKVDTAIEGSIEKRCKRLDKGWNETVRELFCIEFNIKQQVNTPNMDLNVTQLAPS
jgi:hypothetical protein